jgi:uncharacterized membrane protein YedE/YeeE
MGAIADVVHMGAWQRAIAFGLALAVATLGFQGLMVLHPAAALIRTHVLYLSPQWPWVSGLLGGFLFGAGMVLASGCGLKNLLRLGQGSFKAAFVLLIMAVSALATLKGVAAVARVQWLDPWVIGNHSILEIDTLGVLGPWLACGLPALAMAYWLWRLHRQGAWAMAAGGMAVGLCVAALWLLMLSMAYIPEHPNTLESAYLATYTNRPEAGSFVAPMAYTLEWLMYFSDPSRKATAGMALSLGVLIGGWASARRSGYVRGESFRDVQDTVLHVTGALLMGMGGVLGWGCSIGQGLSGMSTLALGSVLTVLAMVLGAVVAMWWHAGE